jgi:hypothetical protein
MRRSLTLAILAGTVSVVSCSELLTGDCAGVGRPAVAVAVQDASTGLSAAAGATLILRSTACADSVVGTTDADVLSGCVDYDGVFTVTVRKPGFHDWVQTNVRVRKQCSVETQQLTARLERS